MMTGKHTAKTWSSTQHSVSLSSGEAEFYGVVKASGVALGQQSFYTDLGYSLPSTPISLSAHLGYTDGVLAPPFLAGTADDSGLDWSIGASVSSGNVEFGVAYIGVEGPSIDGFTDDAIVGTISASF